jgi:hypothetical protein
VQNVVAVQRFDDRVDCQRTVQATRDHHRQLTLERDHLLDIQPARQPA